MNGKGTFIWANGNKYIGDYKEDKKEGYGVFSYSDGKTYKGAWHNGK